MSVLSYGKPQVNFSYITIARETIRAMNKEIQTFIAIAGFGLDERVTLWVPQENGFLLEENPYKRLPFS